jgi:hypothetical protein
MTRSTPLSKSSTWSVRTREEKVLIIDMIIALALFIGYAALDFYAASSFRH